MDDDEEDEPSVEFLLLPLVLKRSALRWQRDGVLSPLLFDRVQGEKAACSWHGKSSKNRKRFRESGILNTVRFLLLTLEMFERASNKWLNSLD